MLLQIKNTTQKKLKKKKKKKKKNGTQRRQNNDSKTLDSNVVTLIEVSFEERFSK